MEHLANNSNDKINIGISPLVQAQNVLKLTAFFSGICEEMTLSCFVFIFHLKYI